MVIFLSLRHNAWDKRRDDLVLGSWFQELPICGHSAYWTQWQGTMPVTSWWLGRESGRNRLPVTWLPPPKPHLPHSMWSLWPNLQDRLRRTFKMWLILSSQCHMRNRGPTHTFILEQWRPSFILPCMLGMDLGALCMPWAALQSFPSWTRLLFWSKAYHEGLLLTLNAWPSLDTFLAKLTCFYSSTVCLGS